MSSLHGDDIAEPLMRSKTYDDSEMDITPMIDITFLLLIFFIVASKMEEGADITLPPAKYGKPVPQKNSVIITLKAAGDGKAEVFKGASLAAENLVDGSDVDVQENEIAEYVESEMASNPDLTHVLVKAEKGIKHGEVARITKAATRPESVQQLFVAVLEVQ